MTIKRYSEDDASLNTLLELNGEIFPMDNGYWTKIEAYRVEPDRHIPRVSDIPLRSMTGTIIVFWVLIMLTLTNPKKRNSEPVKLLGIINTGERKYYRMNMNLQVSCWKISGLKPNRLSEKNK